MDSSRDRGPDFAQRDVAGLRRGKPGTGNQVSAPIPNPQSPIPLMVNVDAAIDVVARQLTVLEAPSDLRGRVLATIGSSVPRTTWWRVPAWATAAAAALLATLLWMWPQPAPGPAMERAAAIPPEVTQPAIEQRSLAVVPSNRTVGPQSASILPQQRPAPDRTAGASPAAAATAESKATDPEPWVVVELLPDPNPIAIEPLSTGPIQITTLSIQELRVDPVDPGRDPSER